MLSFADLKKNLKKDFSDLPTVKVAVLADSASQLFVQALRGYAFEVGLNLEIYEADIDQIGLEIFNSLSYLYSEERDYVIIFQSAEKLLEKFSRSNYDEKILFASSHIDHVNNLYKTILEHFKAKVIYFNFAEGIDQVFGNYANKTEFSFVFQLRKINYELMGLAQKSKNLFINDLSALCSQYGLEFVTNLKVFIQTSIIFSFDFLPKISKNTLDIILSIEGKFKKCLILDLDNTLWGGIIGDDGIEKIEIGELGIGKAFIQIQSWAKQLKDRGIILAICSKNTEEIAKEPFEKHPDMILRLEDIAVFVANWDSKINNIQFIKSVLNIGFDSMVFLDDNPYERMIVKSSFPEITVPELPIDPVEYLPFLNKLNLFETASFVLDDTQRTKQYQEETNRVQLQKAFKNEDDFLSSLDMIAEVQPFNKYFAPRLAQLSQRSNQFNFRTIRFTELDIINFISSENFYTLSFTLKDKYGDHGLISMMILERRGEEQLFIHSWLMSCRILKRTMENFILNTIAELGIEHGIKEIVGQYIPTKKNGMVRDYYENNGFTNINGEWYLNLINYTDRKTFIKLKK